MNYIIQALPLVILLETNTDFRWKSPGRVQLKLDYIPHSLTTIVHKPFLQIFFRLLAGSRASLFRLHYLRRKFSKLINFIEHCKTHLCTSYNKSLINNSQYYIVIYKIDYMLVMA